ncbi:MarR family transcriptional regulator [Christensenellaceae bacterium OttesenSCG-928-K19]|nr:MarR family transcriptional regulator [Christensenellaceae bacterium OttesenSCG-928-K19]
MDSKENSQIASLNAAMSRIKGLYSRWAQQNNINYFALNILYTLYVEGMATQKRISDGFGIPKQSINNVVTTMKKDGLIDLISNLEDKRVKELVLTTKGRKYAKEILSPLMDIENRVVSQMEDIFEQFISTTNIYGDILEQEMSKADSNVKGLKDTGK